MRYRHLLWYWLAVALVAMLSFAVPGVGFVIGIGALLYFLQAIGYWLAYVISGKPRPAAPTLFGRPRQRVLHALVVAALLLTGLCLLLDWRFAACFGGALIIACGEHLLVPRGAG